MSSVPFLKMNGLGNEIIVADMRGRADRVTAAAAIAVNADPATRFDQVMAIHDPRTAGTANYIEIINSDGSLAEACGNGMRCVVQALSHESGRKSFTFETLAGILTAEEHADGMISVDMGRPRFAWYEIPLSEQFADTRQVELQIGPIDAPILHSPAVVSMGNPHATFFVSNDVWSYQLDRIGPMLETHPIFPELANISIAQVVSKDRIILRTWERGAGLTKACGTAACAAAVAAMRKKLTDNKVTMTLPGGPLVIEWRDDGHVWMTGPVETEFEGFIDPETLAWSASEKGAA